MATRQTGHSLTRRPQFQHDTTWKHGIKTTSRALSKHTTHFCSPSFATARRAFSSETFAVAAARVKFSNEFSLHRIHPSQPALCGHCQEGDV